MQLRSFTYSILASALVVAAFGAGAGDREKGAQWSWESSRHQSGQILLKNRSGSEIEVDISTSTPTFLNIQADGVSRKAPDYVYAFLGTNGIVYMYQESIDAWTNVPAAQFESAFEAPEQATPTAFDIAITYEWILEFPYFQWHASIRDEDKGASCSFDGQSAYVFYDWNTHIQYGAPVTRTVNSEIGAINATASCSYDEFENGDGVLIRSAGVSVRSAGALQIPGIEREIALNSAFNASQQTQPSWGSNANGWWSSGARNIILRYSYDVYESGNGLISATMQYVSEVTNAPLSLTQGHSAPPIITWSDGTSEQLSINPGTNIRYINDELLLISNNRLVKKDSEEIITLPFGSVAMYYGDVYAID